MAWLESPQFWWLALLSAAALWALLRPRVEVHVTPPAPPTPTPEPPRSAAERINHFTDTAQKLYDTAEKVWGVRWFALQFVSYRFVVLGDHSRYRLYQQAALRLAGDKKTREVREEDVYSLDEWGDEKLSHTELTGVLRSQWLKFEDTWVYLDYSPYQPPDREQGRLRAEPQSLTFHFISREQEIIQRFRAFAEDVDQAREDRTLTIYHPRWSAWSAAIQRRPRPTESLFFNGDLHLELLEDYRRFQARRQDYHARGRLHKRGYLLSGAPGGGKTNLALWLASQLQMNIAVLSTRELDDDDFTSLVLHMPANTLLLLEDIDTVVPASRARPEEPPEEDEEDEEDEDEGGEKGEGKAEEKPEPQPRSKLSLGTLLNTLDGLLSREGQVVIMTTNHPERLDPALTRPGRADVVRSIQPPDAETTANMARSWYGAQAPVEPLVQALQALRPVPSAAELEAHFDRNADAAQALERLPQLTQARDSLQAQRLAQA